MINAFALLTETPTTEVALEPAKEEVKDIAGYLGIFHRKKVPLTEITWDEFTSVLAQNNQMTQICRVVRSIDRENNGFITRDELDDIFKSFYPEL